MRLRERARMSAALARCAVVRGRRKLRLDLLKLLPDKIHHKSRAWREMPSRRIDQAERKAGCGKVAQDADEAAVPEIIEDFDQTETGNAISGARGQMHRADVVGEKSAGHPNIPGSFRRDEGPHIRVRSNVVHNTGMAYELGGI